MLDNLRGMAVFASVVRHGSFSGAAKELGITTSAVSQQIRALEIDLGVALLHRSTRKLSLSEAGESLYAAAVAMVKAAEQGRDNVNQLKDEISGSLRIATSSAVAKQYLIPALTTWLHEQGNLSINLISRGEELDMIEDRIDLALLLEDQEQGVPLVKVKQLLLASPDYLAQHDAINHPKDLNAHAIIGHGDKQHEQLEFSQNGEKIAVRTTSRLLSNDQEIALNLAISGYGIIKSNELDAKELLASGQLVAVLDAFELPALSLNAVTVAKEQLPTKAKKCLEMLIAHFNR